MPERDEPVEECAQCGTVTPLGEIAFSEPDDEQNTQYGWLAGVCPKCEGQMPVSYDRIKILLARRQTDA
jgi:hypothetical protein